MEISILSMKCVVMGWLFHLLGLQFFICKMRIMILLALYPRIGIEKQLAYYVGSFVNSEEIYFLRTHVLVW